jgi:hypothetical protein
MDRIFSARVDETTIRKIGLLAEKLKTTKKAIIEEAIRSYAEQSETHKILDALEESFGVWKRREQPEETLREVREKFRRSMKRHQG